MIDKQKIESLFAELDNYITAIKKLTHLAEDEYLSDDKNIYSGRYLLQISIESCINISNHIVAREKLGIPKEYADTFKILNKNKIISGNLLEKLVLMTRFRNRVVHLYWDIDDKLVFEVMKNNYNDFLEFRKAILDYLKNLGL
jgi:uncharacterized protein YutE (UPF0331/DUF86 family)